MRNLRDAELLRLHTEAGDETAFSELVARHVDLVYSAALRQVAGDTALAQDVSQTVFVLLARQARPLSRRDSIIGWLYTTTRFCANRAVRTEHRRRVREHEAHAMREFDPTPDADWERLRPVLDAAMHELGEADREAMLLRYFKRCELRAVGTALGVSEEAARKRVDRALEKLRVALVKRGVTSTAAALVTAMHGTVVTAAPIGLSSTITTAVSTGAVAGGFASTLFHLMASTKIKSTACAVIFAGLLTPAVMQQRALTAVRQETETLRRATQDFSPPLRQMTASAEPLNDAGRDELARLRRDHVDLLRLRGEMGRRLRAAEVQAALDRNVEEGARRWKREVSDREKELKKCTETKLTGGFKLVEARNAGQGTPEATLQSFIWALANQDAAALAELQWPGILPITFPPDKWLEFNEQSCAAFRADHTDGVSGINLLSLRKYAEDRVEVLYGFDSEQPRRPGRPPGGILLVRRIDDRWLIEHDRNSLPGDLERFRAGAPVIETPNP